MYKKQRDEVKIEGKRDRRREEDRRFILNVVLCIFFITFELKYVLNANLELKWGG